MIVLRDERGQVIETDRPIATVEICSDDCKVGRVVMVAGEKILILGPSDRMFADYCKAMRVRPAEEIGIQP